MMVSTLAARSRGRSRLIYEPPDGLEGADGPDERSRADVDALGQGAAQTVHSALFNQELQVPGAAYGHAERLDGRPSPGGSSAHEAPPPRGSAAEGGAMARAMACGHVPEHARRAYKG